MPPTTPKQGPTTRKQGLTKGKQGPTKGKQGPTTLAMVSTTVVTPIPRVVDLNSSAADPNSSAADPIFPAADPSLGVARASPPAAGAIPSAAAANSPAAMASVWSAGLQTGALAKRAEHAGLETGAPCGWQLSRCDNSPASSGRLFGGARLRRALTADAGGASAASFFAAGGMLALLASLRSKWLARQSLAPPALRVGSSCRAATTPPLNAPRSADFQIGAIMPGFFNAPIWKSALQAMGGTGYPKVAVVALRQLVRVGSSSVGARLQATRSC